MPINKIRSSSRAKAAIAAVVLSASASGWLAFSFPDRITPASVHRAIEQGITPPAVELAVNKLIIPWEGLVLQSHWDSFAKIWDICYGETRINGKPVTAGMSFTPAECLAMLKVRVINDYYLPLVDGVKGYVEAPVSVQASLLSGAYNFGVFAAWMGKVVMWTVRLEATDAEGRVVEMSEIASISRDLKKPTGADFGLKLSEGKAVLERLQTRITQRQFDDASAMSRCCMGCGSRRPIHDYQTRTTQTLFGKTVVRLPRFRRCECQSGRPRFNIRCALDHLLPGRTTPELDNVLAELGARHSFREAARILNLFLPTSGMSNHTAVRSRLGKVADQIEVRDNKAPYRMSRATKGPVSVLIDGTYV